MISGLDLLFLEVNSLEESLAFYEGVLGMEVESVNNDSEPPMAKLRGGALRITLAQHLETMLRRGRGVHFFVGVEDVVGDIVVHRAVILVCTRLRNGVELARTRRTELRVEVVLQEREFTHGIRDYRPNTAAHADVGVVNAVDREALSTLAKTARDGTFTRNADRR